MLFIYIALDKLVDGLLHNGPAVVFEKIISELPTLFNS